MIWNHGENQFVQNPKSLDGYVSGRVSVVIPTYNYGRFILHAIKSVLRQNVDDLEIIVVDDGSTDGTSKIINPYKKRLKYIYQENSGLSVARNNGIANSTGEFIQFLDADDLLGPHTLGTQTAFLRRNPHFQIAVCPNRLFTEICGGRLKFSGTWPLIHDHLEVYLCFGNIAPPHGFLARRQVIVETGFFDPQLKACEDWDYWLRAAASGSVFGRNPRGRVYYRKHPSSMSANLKNQRYYDAVLHKRIAALCARWPAFPRGHRLEGRLALSCGAILTAMRASQLAGVIRHEMVQLALDHLDQAIEMAARGFGRWNFLTRLFFCRSQAYLRHPYFRQGGLKGSLQNRLDRLKRTLGAPVLKSAFVADGVISAMAGFCLRSPERCELLKLVLSYGLNRS